MRRTDQKPHGMTLIEIVIVLAIIAIVLTLAYSGINRQRPRANLANIAAELQAALHGARQTALASGDSVVVMIFPDYVNGGSRGRIIIYQDGDRTDQDSAKKFFTTIYGPYDPAVRSAGTNSQVLDTIDLPAGVDMNTTPLITAFNAPLNSIVMNSACPFCAGGTRKGAIRFDSKGQAWFYDNSTTGTSLNQANANNYGTGASFTLTAPDVGGQATLVVLAASGAVQVIKND